MKAKTLRREGKSSFKHFPELANLGKLITVGKILEKFPKTLNSFLAVSKMFVT